MSSSKKIDRDVVASSLFWKILERVISQGGNLIIQIILARILMPAEFGNLAIILAVVNYISIFVQSGVSTAIIQKKDVDQLDIDTIFTISITTSVILYCGVYLLSPSLANYYDNIELVLPIRVTALSLFLYSINSIQLGVLSRNMDFKVIFFRSIIAVPISGIIAIVMAYNGFGLWALIANFIINVALSTLIMALGTRAKVRLRFSWNRARQIYSFSIKVLGASIVSGFSDFFRTMSIGKKYSASDLAYYDKAYTYSYLVIQIVNTSIQAVLLPVFSREQEDLQRLKEMARKSVRITMYWMLPTLLGLFVAAKPAVLVLLTEKWLPCVPYLMLFCIFRISGCMVGIDKQVFLAIGKSSLILYFELFLLIANIVMLLITIPMSVKTIAIGAIIVEYTANIGLVVISSFIYGYSLIERFNDLKLPLFNSCVMMIAMWAVTLMDLPMLLTLLIQMIIGCAVYLLLSILFKDSSYEYILEYVKGKVKTNKI